MRNDGASGAVERPPVRLVCIDVDGTMVGSSGAVVPSVWDAAERARAAGIRLAICSGRPGFGLSRLYAERLDPDGWHIFQNGASIVRIASGRSLSARLAAPTVAMLVERARHTGRLLELYGDDDYAFEIDSDRARGHAALLGVPYRPRPFDSLPGPIVRAQWVVSDAEAAIAVAESHPGLELYPSTSPVMPGTQFLNLTPEGVDKGTAVRALAAEYGLTLGELMYVGDGLNDVPAMRLVGHPVAMANAEPEVRAVAASVVGHVDGGGLVDALALAVRSGARVPATTAPGAD
ncbi:MAG: Cof-type HAD-IIB family hydrolase [Gemmatimonadaceae bacterium]